MPAEAAELVRTVRHDAVAVVTLTDPRRRNAFTLPMVEQFIAALDEAEADPGVAAIVVTGAGDAFCAGADLDRLQHVGTDRAGAEEGLRAIYAAFTRLYECRIPTVAAVNGPAVGAGMNLALVCDVRIAGASARFITRFAELGLHPGGGHTWLLRNAVGLERANAMVLFSQELRGADAAAAGLALESVADDELIDRAIAFAARAAAGPRAVVELAKASLREAAGFTEHAAALENEIGKQLWTAAQPDFPDRLAALTPRRGE